MGIWSMAALAVSALAAVIALVAALLDRAKKEIDAVKIDPDRL